MRSASSARPSSWLCARLLPAILVVACGDEPAAGPAGEPCTADADCGDLRCVAEDASEPVDLDPLALACGPLAGAEDDAHACEQASDCARGICLLAGACARPCASDADCGELERCAEVYARAGDDALQSLHACVALCDVGGGAKIDSEVRRDAISDEPFELELQVAEREEPTFAVLEHLDPDWPGAVCRPPLCVQGLYSRGDAGDTLFDVELKYTAEPPPIVPVATGDHVSPVVLQLPGSGQPGFSADGYLALLASERAGDLRLTTVAGAGGGELDLNVFYVGALTLQPEGDRGPPPLADALDVVDEILGQADISVGDVRQIAISGALPMRGTYFPEEGDSAQGFTMLKLRFGTYVELPGLFQLSAGAGNAAINLFLLSDIEPRMLAREPQAEAGGIPGPPAMHGTPGSGIAIASDMMIADPQGFGRTLAHELAHYLGLFHTSEADGGVIDDLSDTPECRLAQDTDGDGLDRADCEGHGADNLMFWAKVPGTVLTEQQRAVLRANPILH